MKFQKIIFAITLISLLVIGCKNEPKKEVINKDKQTAIATNSKELSLNISGMTCEIGCAKKIASDLSKKEGVLNANIVFSDSIANVKYDANITNKADLIAFVEGIANGMYKASEINKKACQENCKKECCTKKSDLNKKTCSTDCKKECCTKKV